MARNSSVNLDITNQTVGVTISGGTTARSLSWNGTGNQTFTQTFAGNSVYSMPSAGGTADNLLGSSAYTAAGTVLYGSGTGTYPSTLAAGTSGQVLTSTGTALAWGSPVTSLTWTGISGAQTGVASNGYYVTTGNQALTLPTTAAAGTYLAIGAAKGSTGWSIVQNAGQSVEFGSTSTTVGVGGSLASTAVGDVIWMLCTTANTTWLVLNSIGNITIV
jgi:hypothetical protein